MDPENLFTRTIVVNSSEMMGYTGRVRLIDNAVERDVLYEGDMANGRVTGYGVLYGYGGNLVYKGSFLMEMYSGSGELYYPSGNTKYVGDFL